MQNAIYIDQWSPTSGTGLPEAFLVPGELVPFYSFAAPTKASRKQIAQMAPYELEDRLAEASDNLHLTLMTGETGQVDCLVAGRQAMQGWCEKIHAIGAEGTRLLPDYLALPLTENGWTIARVEDRLLARFSSTQGIAMDATIARWWLQKAYEQGRDNLPQRIVCYSDAHGLEEIVSPEHTQWESREIPEDGLFSGAGYVSLLHGDFRVKPRWREALVPYHKHGAVLALLLIVLGAQFLFNLWQMESRVAQLEEQSRLLFRSSFVPEGPIVDMKIQADRVLAERIGQSSGFSGLVRRISPSLQGAGVKVEQLLYGSTRLDLLLTVENFTISERLKDSISEAGVQLEVLEESSTEGGVRLRLRLAGTL